MGTYYEAGESGNWLEFWRQHSSDSLTVKTISLTKLRSLQNKGLFLHCGWKWGSPCSVRSFRGPGTLPSWDIKILPSRAGGSLLGLLHWAGRGSKRECGGSHRNERKYGKGLRSMCSRVTSIKADTMMLNINISEETKIFTRTMCTGTKVRWEEK